MKTSARRLLFSLLLAPLLLEAQVANSAHTWRLAEGAASPPAKVADFAWLAGHWVGTGFGGAHVEEVWMSPMGGSMSGHFRLVAGGRAQVYEVFALVQVGPSVELRLKHFSADLKAWEEKSDFVTFKLVRHAPGEAHFEGLTFRVIDNRELRAWLVTEARDGTRTEQEMVYQRRH